MSVRTGLPGTTSAGDVWHSSDVTRLPGGWIGYVEKTANQNGISTITDISTLSVTVTVGTNRSIVVTGHLTNLQQNTSTGDVKAFIREGSTDLGTFLNTTIVATARDGAEGSVFLQPTAGSHTYKVSVSTSAGTVDVGSSATEASWLLVQDVGPV